MNIPIIDFERITSVDMLDFNILTRAFSAIQDETKDLKWIDGDCYLVSIINKGE